jgi:mono/diheme cytochrome c family protein
MKTKSKSGNVAFAAIVVLAAFSLMSFIIATDGWPVPAADAAKKNPVKSDAASIAAGKTSYTTYCKSCHGVDGKKLTNADLTGAAFKAETDGSVFYKINTGKGGMPSYKTKLADDEDRWSVVNYLRTLK